jgi:hypothetical protein
MANPTKAFGLVAIKNSGDSHLQATVNPYLVASDNADGNLFRGDPVKALSTTNTSVVSTGGYVGGGVGSPAGSLPSVGIASAGATNRILGPIASIGYKAGGQAGVLYKPALTEAVVYVHDDPATLFEVMASAGLAATDVRNNANLVAGAGGDTAFGVSSWALNSAAIGSDATYQVLIHSISKDPVRNDLSSSGTNAVAVVKINLHQFTSTAIAGV